MIDTNLRVLPIFCTPVCYDKYELDLFEIELIKREPLLDGAPFDGLSSVNRNILLKYPSLLEIVNTHIKNSLYDKIGLNIVDDIGYKIVSSWVNKHPPKHSTHQHTHPNSMFTGVLYIDVPDDSGTISFTIPMSVPTWITGTIQPKVKTYSLYNSRLWNFPCPTGVCILFPSHLEHSVSENKSDQDRYTIAFNIMLEGNIGDDEEVGEVLNIKVL